MPTYDVECSACSYSGTEIIKVEDLDSWDFQKRCPTCACATHEFRRVIKQAPTSPSGKPPQKKAVTAAEKDDMRHRNIKHNNPDKVAAAVESVRKGEFEGFKK